MLRALSPNLKRDIDVIIQVNNELTAVNDCLSSNKLYLNVNKSKYMILTNQVEASNLRFCNSLVDRAVTLKFLSIQTYDQLLFSNHIKKLCSSIDRSIGVIRRFSYFVPRSVLRKLYFAFLYSHFTYKVIKCK